MIRRLGVFVTLAAWLAATAAYSATADETVKRIASLAPAERRAFVEAGARKEGQLVLYTSISLTDYPKIVAAFENRYPFVKVNAYRSTPSGVSTRVETEARAGRYAADVVASAPVEMWEFKQRGLSTAYLSPECKAMPAGSYDAQGYWLGFEVTPLVLAFNTRQVASNAAPQSYGDLLDPKWKGKMSLGTDEYTWFNVMLEAMGRQKGT
ncbi:MAG TPA: extracellular solute-binding protein, partial [Candidatus Binatia bacterium]|nr:extracellular solute-binding protein [Candidatus Binatia bacterium]